MGNAYEIFYRSLMGFVSDIYCVFCAYGGYSTADSPLYICVMICVGHCADRARPEPYVRRLIVLDILEMAQLKHSEHFAIESRRSR